MNRDSNRKILGAFVVGIALVAGAYTLANFSAPGVAPVAPSAQTAAVAAPRVPIEVTDTDKNGIEDWRDSFVTTEPIVITDTDEPYTAPDTLTGQLGISLIQSVLQNRAREGLGMTDEEMVRNLASLAEQETAVLAYGIGDITVQQQATDQDIKNYFNALALALTNNSPEGMEPELSIFYEIIQDGETEKVTQLETIASSYKAILTSTLATPVPEQFVKEHLDLINTYHAIQTDIDAMTKFQEDPLVSLLRLRRYEDDVLGMQYALENIYGRLTEHAQLFTADDPALVFSNFNSQKHI